MWQRTFHPNKQHGAVSHDLGPSPFKPLLTAEATEVQRGSDMPDVTSKSMEEPGLGAGGGHRPPSWPLPWVVS